jgi:hypothetical protein
MFRFALFLCLVRRLPGVRVLPGVQVAEFGGEALQAHCVRLKRY